MLAENTSFLPACLSLLTRLCIQNQTRRPWYTYWQQVPYLISILAKKKKIESLFWVLLGPNTCRHFNFYVEQHALLDTFQNSPLLWQRQPNTCQSSVRQECSTRLQLVLTQSVHLAQKGQRTLKRKGTSRRHLNTFLAQSITLKVHNKEQIS